MKKYRLLPILLVALTTNVFSQYPCPDNNSIDIYNVMFSTTTITSVFPGYIYIPSSDGSETIRYTLTSSSEVDGTLTAIYNDATPAPAYPEYTQIDVENMTVDFGSGFTGPCIYGTGSTLPVDDYNYLEQNVSMFPSVLTKNKTLHIQFSTQLTSTIKIFNSTGQVLKSIENNTKNNLEVELDNFSFGIYYVKIKAEQGTATQKIIIAN